jgi:hypothetical protein
MRIMSNDTNIPKDQSLFFDALSALLIKHNVTISSNMLGSEIQFTFGDLDGPHRYHAGSMIIVNDKFNGLKQTLEIVTTERVYG